MKILIATGIYPPEIGGPATYSKLLHDMLPDKGIETKVLPFNSVGFAPKIFKHFFYFLKVLKEGKDVDIIYAQDTVSVGFVSAFAAKILKKKFIVKIVGDHAWEQGMQRYGVTDLLDEFSTKHGYGFVVELFKKLQTYSAKHADGVVVPSNYLKGIVLNWGVEPDKITVVYNAFDRPRHKILEKTELRKKYNLTGPIIISAGRLVPWKGFEQLIDTFFELRKKYNDALLIIAGEGSSRQSIEKKIKQLGLKESVMLTGKLPQDKLYEYVVASDVFVLNTSYEGLSHQLLEVMYLKTPIVTTKVGGNPELIVNGESGILTNYNDHQAIYDAIQKILSANSFSAKLTENAYTKVAEFTQESMLNNISNYLLSHKS